MDFALPDSIAFSICRRCMALHLLDDAKQEARLAFWECSLKYDPSVSPSLNKYASSRVRGAVFDFLRDYLWHGRSKTPPHISSFNDLFNFKLSQLTENPAKKFDRRIEARQLADSIAKPEWLRAVNLYFYEDHTQKEVGQKLGYSAVRAGVIIQSAIERVRAAH